MPTGKPIAECLQGLGLLAQGPKPTKKRWPKTAKTVYGHINALIASIEEEDRAGGHTKPLNERIKARTLEWVDKYSDLWTLKHRGSLFPEAPLYPTERSTIASWVEQLVQKKLHQAHYNRNKQMEDDNLLGSESHNDNHVQGVTRGAPIPQKQDNEESSESSDGASERAPSAEVSSKGEETASFNQSPASHTTPVSASIIGPVPMLQASNFNAIISYRSPEPRPTHSDDPYERRHRNLSSENVFTSLAYPTIAFPEAMFSRIFFLVQPSEEHSQSAGRIMGLPEAQVFLNFRNGALERLKEIGERIGSRKLVATFETLPTSFLVQNSHDHYFMLAFVKSWAEWKSPSLCVVCISLENKA